MTRRKKRKRDAEAAAESPPRDAQSEGKGGEQVSMGEWQDRKPPAWRKFPGPRGAAVPLRVAFERDAHAEVMAHAKGSLDAEVCGVLAGEVCEDDDGLFLHVQAAIRGTAARESGGHVTFTQETWSAIHQTLDSDHPKLQIVGWYHSHPGFGVAFSDMDLFIQENFFPAPTQVALVVDPVSGDEALCVNTRDGVRGIDRFWIEGREQRCQLPPGLAAEPAAGQRKPSRDTDEAVQAKLNQLIQTLDEQHAGVYRILLTLGMIVAFAVVLWVGFSIYIRYVAVRYEPPKALGLVSGQVRVGEKTVLLAVPVVQWEVPRQMDLERENARLRQEVAELKQLIRDLTTGQKPDEEASPETKPGESGKPATKP